MSKISSRIDVAVAFYDVYLVIQFLPGFEPSESQIRTYYDNMWSLRILLPFVHLVNVKNTLGGVLLLVKLPAVPNHAKH